jgi:integrase
VPDDEAEAEVVAVELDDVPRPYVITERTKNGDRLIWPLEGWPLKYVKRRVSLTAFPGDYLFPGPGGGKAYHAVHRTLPKVVRSAGLNFGRKHQDGITFHTFRHSMASLALNHGVPESVVQRMGNWKTRVMVDRYAHLADETLRAGAATLAKLVGRAKSDQSKRAGSQAKSPRASSAKKAAYEMRTPLLDTVTVRHRTVLSPLFFSAR